MSLRDYFSNNRIFTGTEKPTQGKFGVGDIIVNIGPNSAEEPMWICVEAGTPGVWELCSGVNEEEIADIVQANALSAVEYTDGVDIQIDGGEIGNMNELQTTNKSSIVGAINELFQSANNGKELIASAIGEPVSSEDTFQAMSNDINGLLSTFKTNMMNNGVTVGAGDKFKALIDKIATLADNEGKGIQIVEGTTQMLGDNGNLHVKVTGLNFKPSILIVVSPNGSSKCLSVYIQSYNETKYIQLDNGSTSWFENNLDGTDNYINDSGFKLKMFGWGMTVLDKNVKWYAIGVGEEDTTLRDSLASILTEEGVEVTEEDDMASLISKVDSEFTKDNNNINDLNGQILELESNLNNLTNDNNTNTTKWSNLLKVAGYNVNESDGMNELYDILNASCITTKDVKEISCGNNHAMVIKNDGSLWACGHNVSGQLGLNNTTNKSKFTKVTTNINNDVKQVACGQNHTFILKNDGSLWACGNNSSGELGLGNTTTKTTFTQVTTNIDNDVKQVVCGGPFTFILKNDGSLWACGDNGTGQLGLGDQTDRSIFTQVTTNINNDVKEVICGYQQTFILKNDGSVWSCGYNGWGELGLGNDKTKYSFTQVTTNISDVKQIACGGNHTFILKNDGSIWSCGYNGAGNLGLGAKDTKDHTTFVQVTTNINNDVKQIACGGTHTFILKNDGSVWSCGANNYGDLGLNTATTIPTASFTQVTINVDDVKDIVCGNEHTFILKNDGSVWSCGYNQYGQLGLNNTTNVSIFTKRKGFLI